MLACKWSFLLKIVVNFIVDFVFFLLFTMGRVSVSEKQKIQIETLLNDGQCQRTVAKKIGISQNCVKNVFAKIRHNFPLKNVPGQGQKRATTSADDRYLLQLCKQDRVDSCRQSGYDQTVKRYRTQQFVVAF